MVRSVPAGCLPIEATESLKEKTPHFGPLAQMRRAAVSKTEGRGFEPHRDHYLKFRI